MFWINAAMLAILAVSVVTDLKSRKIYNKVIYPGFAAAFILQTGLHGWAGLGAALGGSAVGLSLLLIPYLLGGMGAGDVKLLALIGAFKGTGFVLFAAAYMAILGAVMALTVLLLNPGAGQRIKSLFYYLYGLRYGIKLPVDFSRRRLSAAYPYGVAIAGGAVAGMLKGWWG